MFRLFFSSKVFCLFFFPRILSPVLFVSLVGLTEIELESLKMIGFVFFLSLQFLTECVLKVN